MRHISFPDWHDRMVSLRIAHPQLGTDALSG